MNGIENLRQSVVAYTSAEEDARLAELYAEMDESNKRRHRTWVLSLISNFFDGFGPSLDAPVRSGAPTQVFADDLVPCEDSRNAFRWAEVHEIGERKLRRALEESPIESPSPVAKNTTMKTF
ncbi:hypothetical protein SAMN05444167_0573 [Terriglobus roseus]|uniref:Uncharacterized protein n=1 Tax=Terriglobus roseus TaxID=392734 RepID=A0A1G7G6C7_9BACT|nr:hypothetical protein SAMN05444167_0573 [Terriglobus roseus]